MQERTVVQLVLINETGDSYYRMRWPGRHLARQEPAWRIISLDARARERFEWARHADLLILYQSNDLDLLPLIRKRRDSGLKTLVEYNDNFYEPPAASPVSEAWRSPLLWQAYERFMQEADGVIVTGSGLAQLFAQKTTRPIYVLENHLPHTLPDFCELWQPPDQEIRLGWAGSLSHMADLLALAPTLHELLATHPQWTLHLMGNEAIPSLLKLSEGCCHFTAWGTMAQYYEFWRHVHIGFAATLDTPCNLCRSDIKAVEMSGCGVLPVLPDLLPYQSFLKSAGAPMYRSVADFQRVIEDCAGQPDRLTSEARRCFEFVRDERLGDQRTERCELYTRMMPSERVPFEWPLPPGYHEILGTSQSQLSHVTVLQQVESELARGNPDRAIERLERALAINPYDPELAVAHIRVLKRTQAEGLSEQVEVYRRRFPLDLRFSLARIAVQSDWEARRHSWQQLVEELRTRPTGYLEFFQTDVVTLFCRECARGRPLSDVGQALIECFPDSADLRFAVAEQLRAQGRWADAASHFQWLVDARRKCLPNRQFFEKTDIAYLKSWNDALQSRSSPHAEERIAH